MQVTNNNKNLPWSLGTTAVFESWGDFARACALPIHPMNDTPSSQRPEDTDSPWFGSDSWGDAAQMSVGGVPVLEARVRTIAASFEALIMAGGRNQSGMTAAWDVAGDEPDIERYLLGEPENMVTYLVDERVARGPIVTIAAAITASARMNTADIERRGAAIVALVDLVEQGGQRAEVWCTHGCTAPAQKESVSFRLCLKRPDEPLDLTRLVYALVHPSMMRRHVFRFLEIFPLNWKTVFYGRVSETLAQDAAQTETGAPDIWVESIDENNIGESEDAARRWLDKTLRTLEEKEVE